MRRPRSNARFIRHCPRSAQHGVLQVFPGGVTHDNRRVLGNSLYISKARGARKSDADGNDYIDYWMGHGADSRPQPAAWSKPCTSPRRT